MRHFSERTFGVNADGSLAVGLLWRAQVCKANAGYWDLINGGPAIVLPTLFDGPATRANAINADGSVIVGWQDQPTGERTAAKWVNGVPELILTPSGGFNGEAMAVSADGNIIVGGNYNLGAKRLDLARWKRESCRWDAAQTQRPGRSGRLMSLWM